MAPKVKVYDAQKIGMPNISSIPSISVSGNDYPGYTGVQTIEDVLTTFLPSEELDPNEREPPSFTYHEVDLENDLAEIGEIIKDAGDFVPTGEGGISGGDIEEIIRLQAELNRYDVDTPVGSVRWVQDENGQWRQTLDFSEETAPLFQDLIGAARRGPRAPTAPDFSQLLGLDSEDYVLPDVPEFSEFTLDPSQYQIEDAPTFDPSRYDTSKLTDAEFQLAMSYLEPEFEQRSRALEQRLANMGLPTGSEIYGEEFGTLYEAEDEARRRAAWEAVGKGKEEQQRLWANELASFFAGMEGVKSQYGIESDIMDDAFRAALTGYGSEVGKVMSEYGIESDIYDDELQRILAEHGTGIDVFNAAMQSDASTFAQLASLLSGAPQGAAQPIDVITPYQMQQQSQMFAQGQQDQFWNNILGTGGNVLAAYLLGG